MPATGRGPPHPSPIPYQPHDSTPRPLRTRVIVIVSCRVACPMCEPSMLAHNPRNRAASRAAVTFLEVHAGTSPFPVVRECRLPPRAGFTPSTHCLDRAIPCRVQGSLPTMPSRSRRLLLHAKFAPHHPWGSRRLPPLARFAPYRLTCTMHRTHWATVAAAVTHHLHPWLPGKGDPLKRVYDDTHTYIYSSFTFIARKRKT